MEILIGMDEAGYGPNYGPLVVAATAWQVESGERGARSKERGATQRVPGKGQKTRKPGSVGRTRTSSSSAFLTPPSTLPLPHSSAAPDLYHLLRTVVAKRPSARRLAIADSKSLFTPGLGLRQLELGLHAVLLSLQQSPTSWSAIVDYCQADPASHHKTTCWPDDFNCQLPIDAAADEPHHFAMRLTRAYEIANARPLLIRARMIYPAQFNDLVAHHGSKGAALSHITVGLLREIIDSLCPPAPSPQSPVPVHAVCDKHGGRNFYAALLQHHFSEHWIEPIHESRPESRYEWGPPESRTRVAFRMKGESFLPTALASMTAKYLRELSMRAFNQFWASRVPDLKPTAGYPKDAQRFRKDIAATQHELKIDDHFIWRNR